MLTITRSEPATETTNILPHCTLLERGAGGNYTQAPELKFDKPVMLCLGGIAAKAEGAAQGFEATALQLIGGEALREHAHFYTIHYRTGLEDAEGITNDYIQNGITQNGKPTNSANTIDNYAKQIVNGYLEPVIPEASVPQAFAKAAAVLGKLNFFGYSIGSTTLRYIHRHMEALLEEKGFDHEQQAALMQRVKAITIGELAHWRFPTQDWHFTSFHVSSANDEIVEELTDHARPKPSLEMITPKGMPKMLVAHVELPKTYHHIRNRRGDEHTVHETTDPTGHTLFTYCNARFSELPHAQMVRTMLQSAMRNAFIASQEGRDITDPKELLAPVLHEQQKAYGMNNDYLGNTAAYLYKDRLAKLFPNPRTNGHTPSSLRGI